MKNVLLAATALALAACATPYGERNFFGGVSAQPMGGDVYRIDALLNARSDQSRLQDFLLLRAAETALEQGAIGFVILESRDASRHGTIVTPGTSTTTATVNAYGNTATGVANTTYSPAQAYGFVRPGGIMLINLVRQPPTDGSQYFDARQIEAAIAPRLRR